MSNFRPIDRDTGFLLPPSVDEWLPERHLARFVVEVIEGLDLRSMSGSYLTQGSTVSVDVAGSAWNYNTIHFVRVDVDPSSGDLSVGGVAYGNTAAFRAAVQDNWDPGIAVTGGRGDFRTVADWTVSTGDGYYVPVLATEGGDTFVVGSANVDGLDHIRNYGQSIFGFEDLRADQNSDFDYNDLVMKVTALDLAV